MKKLYDKSEIGFALLWIGIYVVCGMFVYPLSDLIGVEQSANAIANVAIAVFLLVLIFRWGLAKKYGLCKANAPAKAFLWFIPLALLATANIWFGAVMNLNGADLACYLISMCAVGIVEELLFRGLLFRAMEKDSLKAAIIVSSVTFGLGHVMNLLNGSGQDIFTTLLQMVTAVALGFLLVVIVWRGGTILPCIIAHSVIDMLSAFANMDAITPTVHLAMDGVEIVIILAYVAFLWKKLPAPEDSTEDAE